MAPILINKDGVSIYVRSNEHLPPHIHVEYGDDKAMVDIRSGRIIEGYIPGKKLKIVQRWLDEADNRMTTEESFFEFNPGLRIRNQKSDEQDEI